MVKIKITQDIKDFVAKFAEKQNIGGFSNLKKFDLNKASRLDFQYTGLYGEAAWYLWRHGSIDKLETLLLEKETEFKNTKKGDNGLDAIINFNGVDKQVDIKSSYVDKEEKINTLNLVVPEREYHDDQIYVGAFTIGKSRKDIDEVVLKGWCLTEDIKDRWHYDRSKYAVKSKDLKDMDLLKKE